MECIEKQVSAKLLRNDKNHYTIVPAPIGTIMKLIPPNNVLGKDYHEPLVPLLKNMGTSS